MICEAGTLDFKVHVKRKLDFMKMNCLTNMYGKTTMDGLRNFEVQCEYKKVVKKLVEHF